MLALDYNWLFMGQSWLNINVGKKAVFFFPSSALDVQKEAPARLLCIILSMKHSGNQKSKNEKISINLMSIKIDMNVAYINQFEWKLT